jgi:NAD(P)-dependent dehydrogenase (short-subunit alcohol dehydrogenase family)
MTSNARLIVITGANRGIGLAIARRFHQSGDRIIILDLEKQPSDEAMEVVSKSNGKYYPCDVSNKSVIDSVMEQIYNEHGFIEVLVNNAGVQRRRSFLETTEEDFDFIFNVNVKSIYLVSQPVVRHMMRENRGCIINMASMGGKWGGADESAYCASKAAVIELTKTMAMALGPHNINVNSVCPGIIMTEMAKTLSPEVLEAWTEKSPLGRLGSPEEVAEVFYFLSSPSARYMTGQAINVTGGMIMY